MKKQDLRFKKTYQKLKSTGQKPAVISGPAKVHKTSTPLRPVLPIPGSPDQKLKKFLLPLFERAPRFKIESSILHAREKLETIEPEEKEQTISSDFKSLYTNVPVSEAIEIALRSIYSSDNAPDIKQSALKLLLKLAVTKVHFKNNIKWYCQEHGLAVAASP